MGSSRNNPKICIMGAGFSGMCAAIKLQRDLNIFDYTIFEEQHDVGGTWLTHTYPGAACDVASHLYSYSFELNPNWSTTYAVQPEILAYLKKVALKYDLYNKVQFHHQVKGATWDENLFQWRLLVLDKLSGKTLEQLFDIIIGGNGPFIYPKIPEQFLNFEGPVIHSAKWDSNVVLDNKTVALVGSGCSAVQICPTILPKVKKLYSFQRHPAWVVPFSLFHINEVIQWIFSRIPLLMWFYRVLIFLSNELAFRFFKGHEKFRKLAKWWANSYLRWEIPDNLELRNKLVPNYEIGFKRVTLSTCYYKALANPKCEVIREEITSVTGHSIATEGGKKYPIDVVILATGYNVQDFYWPLKIHVRNSEEILKTWKTSGPSHYLGIMINKAPNAFLLLGPNTAYGHNSVVFSIECQVNWIMKVIREFINRKSKVVCVKKSAEKQYMSFLKENFKDTVWASSECETWYNNHLGINTTLYPGSSIDYWRKTKVPNWADIDFS